MGTSGKTEEEGEGGQAQEKDGESCGSREMETRQLWGERKRRVVTDRKRGVETSRVREKLRIIHGEVRGEKLRQRQ